MIEDCVIIGGGVAGLSAANQLADSGISPLVIDGGKFPSHKICGEFFSHECLSTLANWKIPMSGEILKARFINNEKESEFNLPISSSSCSRYKFDSLLLQRALDNGVKALTEVSVISLAKSADLYEILLSNDQVIVSKSLMIGTGRIPKLHPKQKNLEMSYYGFKAHFENIAIGQCVEMHLFNGGYLGISNIDEKTTNIACLVKKEFMDQFENPASFMDHLLHSQSMSHYQKRMRNAKMVYPNWMMGQLPEFGIRNNPKLENIFWIGDAAGSIPPICGEGLAIAITSGCMAADYFIKGNAKAFHEAWLKRYRRRFYIANYIHKIMTTNWIKNVALTACNTFPTLPVQLWAQTREL